MRPMRDRTPPSADAIAAFLETSRRYGHWHGTPRENAEIGLVVPTMPSTP
jgi:hypothetical protein